MATRTTNHRAVPPRRALLPGWRKLTALLMSGVLLGTGGCANLRPKSSIPGWVQSPEKIDAKLAYGQLCERHGQTKQAQAIYQSISDGASVQQKQVALHRLGVMAAKRGDFAEAENCFQRATSTGQPSAELLNDLGYCYFLQHRLEEAETCFRSATKRDPDFAAAHTNLGLALGQQGKFDAALSAFRNAGTEAQAHANMAYVFAQHQYLPQAQTHYLKALSIDESLKPAAEGLMQVAHATRELQRTNKAKANVAKRDDDGLPPLSLLDDAVAAQNRSPEPTLAEPRSTTAPNTVQASATAPLEQPVPMAAPIDIESRGSGVVQAAPEPQRVDDPRTETTSVASITTAPPPSKNPIARWSTSMLFRSGRSVGGDSTSDSASQMVESTLRPESTPNSTGEPTVAPPRSEPEAPSDRPSLVRFMPSAPRVAPAERITPPARIATSPLTPPSITTPVAPSVARSASEPLTQRTLPSVAAPAAPIETKPAPAPIAQRTLPAAAVRVPTQSQTASRIGTTPQADPLLPTVPPPSFPIKTVSLIDSSTMPIPATIPPSLPAEVRSPSLPGQAIERAPTTPAASGAPAPRPERWQLPTGTTSIPGLKPAADQLPSVSLPSSPANDTLTKPAMKGGKETIDFPSRVSAPAPADTVKLFPREPQVAREPQGIAPPAIGVPQHPTPATVTPQIISPTGVGPLAATPSPPGMHHESTRLADRFAAMRPSREPAGSVNPTMGQTPAAKPVPATQASATPASSPTSQPQSAADRIPNIQPPTITPEPIRLEITGNPSAGSGSTPRLPVARSAKTSAAILAPYPKSGN